MRLDDLTWGREERWVLTLFWRCVISFGYRGKKLVVSVAFRLL